MYKQHFIVVKVQFTQKHRCFSCMHSKARASRPFCFFVRFSKKKKKPKKFATNKFVAAGASAVRRGGGAPEASRRRKRRDACGAGVGRARANARPGDCRSARGRVAACDPITAGGAVPWRPGLVVSPAPGCTGRMPPRVGHARVCPRDDACRQLPLSCRHPRVLLCVSQPVARLCTAAPPTSRGPDPLSGYNQTLARFIGHEETS